MHYTLETCICFPHESNVSGQRLLEGMSDEILLSLKYLCIHLSYCEIILLKGKPLAKREGDSDEMWHGTVQMLT